MQRRTADADPLPEEALFLRQLACTAVLTGLDQWEAEAAALVVYSFTSSPHGLRPAIARSELVGLCRSVSQGLKLLVEESSNAAHAGITLAWLPDDVSLGVLSSLARSAHHVLDYANADGVDSDVKDRILTCIDTSGEWGCSSKPGSAVPASKCMVFDGRSAMSCKPGCFWLSAPNEGQMAL
jgi:hypothetical protein